MPVPSPSPRALGTTVRELRHARALTLESLADVSGFNVTYLSDVERGRANPSVRKLAELAQALEVRLSALIAAAEEATEAELGTGSD